ncbi:septation protein A [Oxalobacter vibrioformis]|uniref:Inner membrane-spanning protein YciB n=1 Tax=Oxalobacter vibrioformis TaxID=933080 RepID=A0A9E9LTS4_9BURK|nr:septation protein A [Oxalobacter vibrioformis]WAW09500.1 septation protein A [Oxalobacter vibrioformis]
MKFLFDLFPVLLFFGVFSWAGKNPEKAQAVADSYLSAFVGNAGAAPDTVPILLATAVAIVATIGQIIYLKLRKRKVEPMLWVSLLIIVIFGGATIYFASEEFIKWKPTVLYWVFGAALLVSNFAMGKNLVRLMMEKQIRLPDFVWGRLNYAWVAFFLVMGVVNLYVAFWGGFATSTWVSFKLFGGMGLMLVFVVGQSIYLARYMRDA